MVGGTLFGVLIIRILLFRVSAQPRTGTQREIDRQPLMALRKCLPVSGDGWLKGLGIRV